ncbi:optic atrophy 3 protein-domain-containing protein [Pelagophyceae sp. CCMP2097]|nr:optic atrophy 3 protein-domain-containing protein [Pelagophyceae sp. CCMP2097]|mmetsp:Transcript_31793/g.111926  ORF Transcript_31793/g.111926 Transcript_31793/m.111926 type:complete len:176 (-) Transcript_31793:144-671(-)
MHGQAAGALAVGGTMSSIPLLKIAGLILKTLAKPVGKQIKHEADRVEWLREACIRTGQFSHYCTSRLAFITSDGLRFGKFRVVDLKNSEAQSVGADIMSETFILTVAASVAIEEYTRSSRKRAIDEARKEAEIEAEKADLAQRLAAMELRLDSLAQELERARSPPQTPRWRRWWT